MGALARHCKLTGKRILARLPAGIRHAVLRRYLGHKLERLRSLHTPVAMTYFVTNACNLRCVHCFYWRELRRPEEELSLEAISRIARSLKHPIDLALTGGEPTLRSDLVDICRVFHEENGCRRMAIATNGSLPARVAGICTDILETLDLESLSIQVSLDGSEAAHDAIRQVEGAHAKAMETIEALQQLGTHDRRLSVHAALCIQQANIESLEGFIDEMQSRRIKHRFILLRGSSYGTYRLPKEVQSGIDPREAAAAEPTVAQLRGAIARVSRREAEGDEGLWSVGNRITIELALRVLETQRRQLPCYAGELEAVLYPGGEVAMCELCRPVGHLEDFEWDMAKLWTSPAAQAMRRLLQQCCCIHGCNLSTSAQFDPAIFSRQDIEPLAR